MKNFKQFNELDNSLQSLSDSFYEKGFLVNMYIKDDSIILMDFKKRDSNLSGTDVMLKITEFADKHNLNIKLVASPVYMDLDKVINFYKKFGFQIIGDYFNIGKEMIRYSKN